MARLQKIRRSNGSTIHHINVPKSVVEEVEWKKGDEIDFSTAKNAHNDKRTIIMEKVN